MTLCRLLSPICRAAMTYSEDLHDVVLEFEEDAVLADTKPKRASEFTVQRPDNSGTRTTEVKDAFKNSHGGFTAHGSHIGFGLFKPVDLIRRHLLERCQVFGADAGFGENFIHGNAMSTTFFEPSLTFTNAPAIFVGDRLVVGRSSG
jgi:hypothetical protein